MSQARGLSLFAIALVLVVQVIATDVPTTPVGSVPRSRSLELLDNVRSEEGDNAVVVEGQYQSSSTHARPRPVDVAAFASAPARRAFYEFVSRVSQRTLSNKRFSRSRDFCIKI